MPPPPERSRWQSQTFAVINKKSVLRNIFRGGTWAGPGPISPTSIDESDVCFGCYIGRTAGCQDLSDSRSSLTRSRAAGRFGRRRPRLLIHLVYIGRKFITVFAGGFVRFLLVVRHQITFGLIIIFFADVVELR